MFAQPFVQAHIKENVKAPRHRWPVDSPHKGPITRKIFSFDDVIMFYKIKWTYINDFYVPSPSGVGVINLFCFNRCWRVAKLQYGLWLAGVSTAIQSEAILDQFCQLTAILAEKRFFFVVVVFCNANASLQWRHNERHSVSNHRQIDSFFKRVFGLTSKKASNPALLALFEPKTSVSTSWYHQGRLKLWPT